MPSSQRVSQHPLRYRSEADDSAVRQAEVRGARSRSSAPSGSAGSVAGRRRGRNGCERRCRNRCRCRWRAWHLLDHLVGVMLTRSPLAAADIGLAGMVTQGCLHGDWAMWPVRPGQIARGDLSSVGSWPIFTHTGSGKACGQVRSTRSKSLI